MRTQLSSAIHLHLCHYWRLKLFKQVLVTAFTFAEFQFQSRFCHLKYEFWSVDVDSATYQLESVWDFIASYKRELKKSTHNSPPHRELWCHGCSALILGSHLHLSLNLNLNLDRWNWNWIPVPEAKINFECDSNSDPDSQFQVKRSVYSFLGWDKHNLEFWCCSVVLQ